MLSVKVKMKSYQNKYSEGKTILENLAFQLNTGEVLAIVGESGCGKSTLLKIISGIDKNFIGEIIYFDSNNNLKSKPKIGVMYQDIRLLPWLTVYENINFALTNNGYEESSLKINQLINDYELNKYRNMYPFELSGGTQQRVALARAIANEPDLLLLDEPLSAVDFSMRKRLQIILKKTLGQNKVTTILVTHDLDEAKFLGDRIMKL